MLKNGIFCEIAPFITTKCFEVMLNMNCPTIFLD